MGGGRGGRQCRVNFAPPPPACSRPFSEGEATNFSRFLCRSVKCFRLTFCVCVAFTDNAVACIFLTRCDDDDKLFSKVEVSGDI